MIFGAVELSSMPCCAVRQSLVKQLGQLPFEDECVSRLFKQIQEAKYEMPHFISEEAKDIINRML